MNSITLFHSRPILNPTKTDLGCNCQQCLTTPSIVYQANTTNNVDKERRVYQGASEELSNDRYGNCLKEGKHEISQHNWTSKICMGIEGKHETSKKNLIISWKIVYTVYSNPKSNSCRLCLKEKLLIIKFSNQDTLFNKRSEFVSKCTNRNKNLINKIK